MIQRFDVIVVGAALNGLAAALALGGHAVRRPLRVALIDARDPRQFADTAFDGRATALSQSARRMFEALGVWETLAPHAQAMNRIIVTDSAKGPANRPVLLQFDAEDAGPTAHMIENRELYRCLLDSVLQSPMIDLVVGSPLTAVTFGPGLAEVELDNGVRLKGSLVVAADGKTSRVRQAANIDMVGWAYDQMAIVVTVEHEKPHNGCAEEHFRAPGPFAILPLPGNRSSLVWVEAKADAERLLAETDAAFLHELEARFGAHLGAVKIVSGRHGYPLGLFVARDFTSMRLALVGDAAHVIHPLAGLGFNLGLRDVAALAECVGDAAALGLDIGGTAVLERYTAWRRFDTVATAAAMDGMNRLFGNDNPFLRLMRDAGLMAVNRMGPLKQVFMREAEGVTGTQPKLLRGILP
jgi:2-octaprenyl-6-methoxyphenol hydroxylase